MSKAVRNFAGIFLLLVVITGLVVGYFYYNKKEIVITQLLKTVPTDAALIFECKNAHNFFSHLQKESNVWSLLTQVPEIKELNSQISWLDSIISSSKELQEITVKGPLIISLHISGKSRYEMLYLMNFGSFISDNQVKTFLQTEFGDSTRFNERPYNDAIIYETQIPDKLNSGILYWAMPKGVFMISKSSIVIEDAIRQTQSDYSLLDKPSFKKVLETSGQNVDGNIYINHSRFQNVFSNFVAPSYQKIVSNSKNIADWSEIDFNVKPGMFMFNGFTNPGDSTVNYLNTLMNQKPQSFTTIDVLPGDVFSFVFLGINNFQDYLSDYKKYLDVTGNLSNYNKRVSEVNKNYNVNIENLFADILDGEIVMAFADNQSLAADSLKSEYLFIKTKSSSLAEERMNGFISEIAKAQNLEPGTYKSSCSIDKETSFPIYNIPVKQIGGILFGVLFERIDTRFFTYIDNYIVFSSSKDALKNLHHSNILKKTLANDAFYKSYTENLDSKSNFLFYIDLSRAKDFASSFMNKDLAKCFTTNFEVFQRLDAISCQMNVSRGMIYNSIIVRYNPEIKERTHTVWESRLDSTISQKPVFLINHVSNEKEILIQDDGGTIYLLNSAGRILWKNHIPEKILSDIFQVDAFNNKKLQYLFNTRNYIYLIDRDGNYLERFPIKLQAPATNGISYIDFTGKNSQRIFVACADKKVYCYNIDGNLAKDWVFSKTDNYVYSPFLFFKVKDKEYIVFGDTLKSYVVDRKGNERITLKDYFPRNHNSRYFFESKNPETEDRIVTNAIDGTICYIYLDGSVKKKSFGEFSENHFFEFKDMDVDGYCDYIFLDEDELFLFNKLKKKVFSYEFHENPSFRPVFYEFPGGKQNKIGIVCQNENKVYMIDREGNLPKGYPLEGCTPFSISHFDPSVRKYNLIVGSKDGFLYNYEVY